jgi:hypothetical protein
MLSRTEITERVKEYVKRGHQAPALLAVGQSGTQLLEFPGTIYLPVVGVAYSLYCAGRFLPYRDRLGELEQVVWIEPTTVASGPGASLGVLLVAEYKTTGEHTIVGGVDNPQPLDTNPFTEQLEAFVQGYNREPYVEYRNV